MKNKACLRATSSVFKSRLRVLSTFNGSVTLEMFSTQRNIFYGGNRRKNGDRCLWILIVSTNIIIVLSGLAPPRKRERWPRIRQPTNGRAGWQRLMLKKCRASRRSCRLIIGPKSFWKLASTFCPQLRIKFLLHVIKISNGTPYLPSLFLPVIHNQNIRRRWWK